MLQVLPPRADELALVARFSVQLPIQREATTPSSENFFQNKKKQQQKVPAADMAGDTEEVLRVGGWTSPGTCSFSTETMVYVGVLPRDMVGSQARGWPGGFDTVAFFCAELLLQGVSPRSPLPCIKIHICRREPETELRCLRI